MGETFKAFIAFISEDPIMLGLCIAIVVLIIMFILVLVLGKKKDKKVETTNDTNDELLKTEINMEALKSTSEYKLDEINNALQANEEESHTDENLNVNSDTKEIPVTTEEPVKVEIEDKTEEQGGLEIKDLTPESNNAETVEYPTFDNIQITENRENENRAIPLEEDLNNISVLESNEVPLEGPNIFEAAEKFNTEIEEEKILDETNVVESSANPIEEVTEVEETPSMQTNGFPIITEENMIKDEPVENSNDTILEETKEEQPIIEDAPLDISNITLEENVLSVTPSIEELISPVKEFEPEQFEEISTQEPIEPAVDAPLEEPIELPVEPEPTTIEEAPIEPAPEEIRVEPTVEESITDIELPTMTSEEEEVELPDYSDIYSIDDDIELPNINFDEFDKKDNENQDSTEDEEGLDLPKLNTNPTSNINSLKGESFKID